MPHRLYPFGIGHNGNLVVFVVGRQLFFGGIRHHDIGIRGILRLNAVIKPEGEGAFLRFTKAVLAEIAVTISPHRGIFFGGVVQIGKVHLGLLRKHITDLVVVHVLGLIHLVIGAVSYRRAVDRYIRRLGLVQGGVDGLLMVGADSRPQRDILIVKEKVSHLALSALVSAIVLIKGIRRSAIGAVGHAPAIVRVVVEPVMGRQHKGGCDTRHMPPVIGIVHAVVLVAVDHDAGRRVGCPEDQVAKIRLGPGGAPFGRLHALVVHADIDAVALPHMRHQGRGPHVIAAVGAVVGGTAGAGDAIQHLLIFGRVFGIVLYHPLQRLDISGRILAAAFVAVGQLQQIAADHPAGTAQHIVGHQVEHMLRHGIVGSGQQIDPQRHIRKQRFAVAVGVKLVAMAVEGVVHLKGFVVKAAHPQVDRQIFFYHFFKLGRIAGRQRPVEGVLRVPQRVLSRTGVTLFVYPAQNKIHRLFGKPFFHHHADRAKPPGHTVAVLPPVGRPGAHPVGVVGIGVFNAGPVGKGFVHPIGHLLAVVVFATLFGPGIRHGQHTVERQVGFPHRTVGGRLGAVIVHITPAAVLVLHLQILARFGNIADAVVRAAAVYSVVAQEIFCYPLTDHIHLLL